MSTSPVNYNLQNLGQSGPQNVFGSGSNQYGGGWPTLPTPSPTAYQVPSSGAFAGQTPNLSSGPGGYYTGTSYDPQLTSNLFGYLGQQVGQGLPQYPGQLTAGPNAQYTNLSSLLSGGPSNLPYGQQMLQMAQTGNPTDVGPAWEAMIKASQQNIEENQAQLKEQYAAGGNLVGTPYGSAMSDYMSQTALGENAILTQAQQQAAEAAAGRESQAQQYLTGADLTLGGQLQGISQAGLTNAYNEFLRTQPQYNPLLSQAYGAATTFPPYLNPQQSPWAMLIPALLNAYKLPNFPGGGGGNTRPGGGGGGSNTPQQTPSTFPPGSSPTSGGTPNYGVNYPWPFPQPQPGIGVGDINTGVPIYDPSQMQYPPDPTSGNYQVPYNPLPNMPQPGIGVGSQIGSTINYGGENYPVSNPVTPPPGTVDQSGYYNPTSGGDTSNIWSGFDPSLYGGDYSGGDLTMQLA